MTSAPIRVLLIDDHPVVLEGYRRLIETAPDMRVVAEAQSGEQGYFAYFVHGPDVVVLDLALPGRGGLDTLQRILKGTSKNSFFPLAN
jgi:two-component system invasion response regulator UvrY